MLTIKLKNINSKTEKRFRKLVSVRTRGLITRILPKPFLYFGGYEMIYFIQAGKNGPIKIGYTKSDIESRIATLQTGCPYELKLLWSIDGDQPREYEIQEMFSHENIRGEWFRPSRPLLNFIELEAANQWNIELADMPAFIMETKSEISINCGGWNISEIKKEREICFTLDDNYNITLDLSGSMSNWGVTLDKYGIGIEDLNSEINSNAFGSVYILILGKKTVIKNG